MTSPRVNNLGQGTVAESPRLRHQSHCLTLLVTQLIHCGRKLCKGMNTKLVRITGGFLRGWLPQLIYCKSRFISKHYQHAKPLISLYIYIYKGLMKIHTYFRCQSNQSSLWEYTTCKELHWKHNLKRCVTRDRVVSEFHQKSIFVTSFRMMSSAQVRHGTQPQSSELCLPLQVLWEILVFSWSWKKAECHQLETGTILSLYINSRHSCIWCLLFTEKSKF